MKKNLSLKLFFLLVLQVNADLYAEDIWTINFSDSTDLNKGYWGDNADMSGVHWDLDISNCKLSEDADYVKVVETSGGRLEAVDCDGEAIWTSNSIDISKFKNCNISVLASETGTSSNTNKYIKLFYKIDNGSEHAFDENGENIGNWGSVEASTAGISGKEMVIVIRINNPLSSNKVYFDDIVVTGEPIVIENDKLTEVSAPASQAQARSISPDIDSEEEAVSCFRFVIDETDSAGDGVPTNISRMTFYNTKLLKGIDWNRELGGVLIYSEGTLLNYNKLEISSDSLYFDFIENQVLIPDGEKREFELKVYLNSEVELTDHSRFQLAIGKNARGFLSYPSGSGFIDNDKMIESEIYTVDIEASRLILFNIPESVIRNQHFQFTVNAVDQFGNLDSDQSNKIKLSLCIGKGELITTSQFERPLDQGVLVFDSLRYRIVDTIQLKLSGKNLAEIISSEIIVENTYESQAINSSWIPEDTILSTLRTHKKQAFKLFEFTVKDAGDDDAPTELKKVSIASSEINQIDFKNTFGGFYFTRDDKELDTEFEVSKDRIEVIFQESESKAVIESETTANFSLYSYFAEGEGIDGDLIQLKINKSSSDWEVSKENSGLRLDFDKDILGPQFICEVEATQMQFSEVPKSIKPNEEFTIEIELLDEFMNQDANSNKKVNISLAAGTGELKSSSGMKKSIENGKIIWKDLIYDRAEHFTIQAEADGFETILSDDISSVDQNSAIVTSEIISNQQLPSNSISKEKAVSVLRFTIVDSAFYDDLPTIIKTAVFYKKELPESFDWQKHIAGAVIKSKDEILAITSDIDNECIKFNSSKGLFRVDNGKNRDLELAVFFRESCLPDNMQFQVFIPQNILGWKTGVNSSELVKSLSKDITSDTFHLNVVADRIRFVSAPLFVKDSSEYFRLNLIACDQYHNIDMDYIDKFHLELLKGDGKIVHNYELKFKKGISELEAIKYKGNDEFVLKATSNLLPDTINIMLGNSVLGISNDFESNDLSEYLNVNDWALSTYQSIKDSKSLKHNLSNQVGSSHISRKLEGWKPGKGSTRWSFILKNGDWDPSSGNYFVFHLCMDQDDPTKAEDLYSVGVNLNGSSDLLSLWKSQKDQKPDLLLQTNLDWNENELVAVQVDYNEHGKWELAYNRLGETENWFRIGEVYSEIASDAEVFYSGLEYYFETASRAGRLWFDNFSVQSVNTAPYIKSHQIVGQDSILIIFSENLDVYQNLTTENFTVNCNGGELSSFSPSFTDLENEILIVLGTNLTNGHYQVEVENILDEGGAVLVTDFIDFDYLCPSKAFDLVINEIMADESPVQGLPEYEYIELYNTNDYPVSLEGWKLQVGSKELLFSADTLSSNSYLILCSNSAVEAFSEYGQTMGMSNFTGLNNSGNGIKLYSDKGVEIDAITYSDSWYKSKDKSKGGWSLERIDAMNTCSSYNNWSASTNANGGTPGCVNSVNSSNTDNKAPQLVSFRLLSENCISLRFDEIVKEESLIRTENYAISSNPVAEISAIGLQAVELKFEKDFTDGKQLHFELSGIADECDNYLDTTLNFVYHQVHEHDLVINEIMADESPVQGLPEYEYIELYNTNDYPVSLEGWKLQVGSKELLFSADTLSSNSYLILCSNSAVEAFSEYGQTMGMSNFTGLNNSGNGIKLYSDKGVEIDAITYSDSWYKSKDKSEGGWSLERIDAMNTCSSYNNWSASTNANGGTPGCVNSVNSSNTDNKAPQLVSFRLLSENCISLRFDEIVKEESLIRTENYAISSNPVAEISAIGLQVVELKFEKDFTDGKQLHLELSGIADECDNYLDTTLNFVYHQVHEHDLVINEIMADESPVQGLPEYEYIELYNTNDYPVSLEGWKLQVGSKELLFSADTLSSNSYLILCSNSAVEAFSEYGQTMGMSNFTGLNNSGNGIKLYSDKGVGIDAITYSDSWYKSKDKSEGGWSLERIDAMNTCSSYNNWSASTNANGGTPGCVNSVNSSNTDNKAPQLVSFRLLSENCISLRFDEIVKEESLIRTENYAISSNPVAEISAIGLQVVELKFEKDFTDGKQLHFELSGIADECDNYLDTTLNFVYHQVHEHDLVINEIMADESPVQGLPEYEYIELYNTNDYPVSLEGWKLQVGSKELLFSADTLSSNSYLILCSNSAVEAFSEYGQTMGMSNFTGLNNSGNGIKLYSDKGVGIDAITYSDSWYKSKDKSEGGWSLERIDAMNTCSSYNNWSASTNANGGTPGCVNSVNSSNTDNKAPQLVSFRLLSENCISLRFDEIVKEESLIRTENYAISSNPVAEISAIGLQVVELKFEKDFTDGKQLHFELSGIADECDNYLDTTLNFVYHQVHEHDLVINEIMADESPVQGLPEYEYIELYNTNDYPVSLEGWKLQVGSKELLFSADTLSSNSYLILCSNSAVEAFSEYGQTMGMSNFTGLNNSGNGIKLYSDKGVEIDAITYSDSWYKSKDKSEGGWSLERIDAMNTCSSYNNWSASTNANGGTPGCVNSVNSSNTDNKAPQLVSFRLLSENCISLRFDEIVKEESLIRTENYAISSNPVAEISAIGLQVVELKFEKDFTDGKQLHLELSGIADECDNYLDTTLNFVYHQVHEHDLVINEIMADESPVQGLPEYEYIELYNTNDYPVSLEGWKLQVGSKELLFSADTLSSNSYLILCSNSAVEAFSEYGQTMGMSNFTGLNNSGNGIKLYSDKGVEIDAITYSDSWYKSKDKSEGGWSLERIDAMNTCSSYNNWSASTNANGGTPGCVNSVNSSNTDNKAPQLVSFRLLSENCISLRFDEIVKEESLIRTENYAISSNPVAEISAIGLQAVELKFEKDFTDGKQLHFELSGIADECDNYLDTTLNFVYHQVHEHDLVINEIMADESPVQGLPEYEYIELYNTNDYPVSLEGWKLQVGSKELLFSADTLSSNSYLILCSNSAVEAFSEYGQTMGMSNFTGLNNSGNGIKLYSDKGVEIDAITYSDSWYKSKDKSEGGWSLERIDAMNTCSSYNNWSASTNANGGTPGCVNSVNSSNTDNKAPQLVSFRLLSENCISLRFDEIVKEESLIRTENYAISSNPVAEISAIGLQVVELKFEKDFTDGKQLHFELSGIADECDNYLDTTLNFVYHQVHEHDLVINEIMADESPVQGLPEYEYIELYNTNDYPVSLEGWKLQVGSKELLFSADTLSSNSYLILCSNSAVEAFSEYGQTMGMSNFTGLNNSGNGIKLYSDKGVEIDAITYSDSWYKSKDKSKGGWSLERIDAMNTCSSYNNWSASTNANGGTPGCVNSVNSSNTDNKAPQLVSFRLLSENCISLRFDEIVKEESLIRTENYAISSNPVAEISAIGLQAVELKFEKDFTDGKQLHFELSGIADECDNYLDTTLNFVYHQVHEHDLVINEIMADESPVQGLPEYEYIELYNTNDYPVSLEGWKLQVGSKELLFSADTLSSNSYLILCSNSAVEAFSEYGQTMGMSNFTGLNNSGNSIKLYSDKGVEIDEITYSDSWYKSKDKSKGGWSLERIDAMNFAWQEPNWTVSLSQDGGTPGSVNSVFSDNKDYTSPEVHFIQAYSTNSLLLTFTEPMLESQTILEANYLLKPDNILAMAVSKISETQFEIVFEEQLIENSKYNLEISENVTDLASNKLKSSEIEFYVPATIEKGDIVINEILFNPFSEGSDYVELYNRTRNIYDLSQLYLGKKDDNYILIDSVRLSQNLKLIFPKEYCLFSADTSHVVSMYLTSNTRVFHQVALPNYPDNRGRIVLFTKYDVIDDLEYSEDMQFELLASKEGVALERVNPDRETNMKNNWQSAAQSIGFGTPGLKNSAFDAIDVSEEEVSLSKKIFSPDNDGVDDRLYINFNLHEDGYVANIRIYNSKGIEIRNLASNYYLANVERLSWDGLSSQKERLPIGIYLVYIELFNPEGQVKVFKKTCVIGGKFK
ncbi:lamin tail domain-containing protein [Marinifilum sp.]|uniref:lamin tail domain-containing protein n=1 Tax=Marinifilum sp. TaxID=2033137 RepID=UPI003BA8D48A